MAVEMVLLLWRGVAGAPSPPGAPPPGFSNTKALGQVLYTDYVFPFELAAVILLVAIVAAIAITLRTPQGDQVPGSARRSSRRDPGRPPEDREGRWANDPARATSSSWARCCSRSAWSASS